ncbi:MAG: right-handed parallel beta-helix repeat-containing protein, partial [Bacteroidota bacterium]
SYTDVPSPYFTKDDGSNQDLKITVYWTNKKNLYIDHFTVYDNYYERLFVRSDSTSLISDTLEPQYQATFGSYVNNSLYSHFYIDEPWPNSYRSVNEMSYLSNQALSAKGKYVNGAAGDYPAYILQYGNSQGRPPYIMTDKYPFWYWYDTASTASDSSVQCALDSLINNNRPNNASSGLYPAIQLAQNFSGANPVPLVCAIQVQAEDSVLNGGVSSPIHRAPTPNEVKVQGFLSMCYGAKGLAYYTLNTQTPPPADNNVILATYGLFDEVGNAYKDSYKSKIYSGLTQNPANAQVPNARYYAVQALNAAIDKISATVLQLTWQNGFTIHSLNGGSTGTYIPTVTSKYGTTQDPAAQTYVELGEFTDAQNNKYFMLVNRRTLSTESRAITANFSTNGVSWEISDVASGNTWIIAPNGSFTDNLNPGEGRLYKVSSATYTATRTIPLGATLTVYQGATASFASGVGLIVNGQIFVNGASTPPATTFTLSGGSGNWGSIQLNGSGASNSTITYANIVNGTEIDVTSANNVTIQNCNITNNSGNGIYVNSSSNFTAQYDSIKNPNSYNGIYISGGSNNNCYYDVISNTNHAKTAAGISYYASSGTVGMNDIDYYKAGIQGSWGSSPSAYLSSSITKNNRVTDCTYGLWMYHLSYGQFGVSTSYPSWGLNSINGFTYGALVGNGDGTASGLYAECDWWGGPPGRFTFYVYSGCYGYFTYPLTADPWSGHPIPTNKLEDNDVVVPTLVQSNSHSTPLNSIQTAVATQSIPIDSLLIGVGLRDQNEYTEAKNFFLSYLNIHPDNQAAYVYLYSCADSETTPAIIQYFNNLPKQAAADHKLLLAQLYLKQGDSTSAKQVNDALIAANPNTPLSVRAELNNFDIALYFDHDVSAASAILTKVESQASLSTPMELSAAEEEFKYYVDPKTGKMPNVNFNTDQSSSSSDSVQAVSNGSLQNYPNPFNPATTISYQIPNSGHVTIKVFDVLGRDVTTLVDEFKPSGRYTVQFDASRLASGIYFYSIRSANYNAVKKMLLLK